MANASCDSFALGEILGHLALPARVTDTASALASQAWDAAAAQEFCGDAVETFSLPDGFPQAAELLPPGLLEKYGLAVDHSARQELIATYGVEQHQDHVHGLVLFLVLHNDGLAFRQGKARHTSTAGDFFVFDDRKNHGVREVAGRGLFLGWAIPVHRLAGARR